MKKPKTLDELRAEIDVVDRGIVLLLPKRFEKIETNWAIKKQQNL